MLLIFVEEKRARVHSPEADKRNWAVHRVNRAMIDQQGGSLQGELKGDYKTNEIHVFNVNLIWRF